MRTSMIVGVTALSVPLLFASVSLASGEIELQPKTAGPLPGLTPAEVDRFFLGKDDFSKTFVFEEGLGPVMNQNSCGSCHNAPVTGGAGTVVVDRIGVIDDITEEFDPLAEVGGSLNQNLSIPIEEYMCDERDPDFEECLEQWVGYCANYTLEELSEMFEGFHTINRITNPSFALGLVEAIPDQDIVDYRDWQVANTPANGKIHWVKALEDLAVVRNPNDAPDRVGRMGWKAQVPTTLSFSADASLFELGLTSWILPDPVAPKGDESLLEICDSIALDAGATHPQLKPDMDGIDFIDRITDFQRFSSPPPQTPRDGMVGEVVFTQIGCADCHRPAWTTADDSSLEPALQEVTFKPYSDFLLHNMGLQGDSIEQGDASGFEIRTPSLWGVRDRDPILHDGSVAGGDLWDRIAGPDGAVQAHRAFGSSAAYAANNFISHPNGADPLQSDAERQLVVDFLDSLGRLEFDWTGDLTISTVDFFAMVECYSGSADSYMPPDYADSPQFDGVRQEWRDMIGPMDHPCAIFDVNQDGFIDETDFALFVSAYEDSLETCELWEILADEVAADGINVNIPAECSPCPGDLNGSGEVNVLDLLILLENWGPADPGDPADLNDDGEINVLDLLILLENWGPCP